MTYAIRNLSLLHQAQNHLGYFHKLRSVIHTSSLDIAVCFFLRKSVSFHQKHLRLLNDLLILLGTYLRALPYAFTSAADFSLHHFHRLQQFVYFHRENQTDNVADLPLLYRTCRCDQKHLKLRWKIFINLRIHHINKATTTDQNTTL